MPSTSFSLNWPTLSSAPKIMKYCLYMLSLPYFYSHSYFCVIYYLTNSFYLFKAFYYLIIPMHYLYFFIYAYFAINSSFIFYIIFVFVDVNLYNYYFFSFALSNSILWPTIISLWAYILILNSYISCLYYFYFTLSSSMRCEYCFDFYYNPFISISLFFICSFKLCTYSTNLIFYSIVLFLSVL